MTKKERILQIVQDFNPNLTMESELWRSELDFLGIFIAVGREYQCVIDGTSIQLFKIEKVIDLVEWLESKVNS